MEYLWPFFPNDEMGAGSDAILLGAETLRGLYPVETISIVGKICAEVCVSFGIMLMTFLCEQLCYQLQCCSKRKREKEHYFQ